MSSCISTARIAGLAALALAAMQGIARADEKLGSIELLYGLNLAGLPVAQMNLNVALNEESYAVTGDGRTVGLVDLLSKIRFSGNATGKVEDGVVRAVSHRYRYSERDKAREVSLEYGEDMKPTITASPEFEESFDRVPLPADKLAGTIDLVSQFIAPGKPGAEPLAPGNCAREYAVFDGRLRVDATVRHLKSWPEGKVRGVNYDGALMRCAVRIEPIGGHKEGDMLSKIARKGDIDVWVAPAFSGRYYVPLKVTLPTPVGTAELVVRRMNIKPAPQQAGLDK